MVQCVAGEGRSRTSGRMRDHAASAEASRHGHPFCRLNEKLDVLVGEFVKKSEINCKTTECSQLVPDRTVCVRRRRRPAAKPTDVPISYIMST